VLLANALTGSPALDTAYEEFVLADDDDGDLSNGTPHLCEIATAFAEHGLGPLADENATPIVVDHLSLTNQVDGSAIVVEATTMNPLESCTPFTLSAGTLWYSVDGGESWLSAPAVVDGLKLSATFPEIPAGSIVSYYLEANGSNGETATAPTIGEIAPYTFYVGELTELWCSGLTEDEGFTHELISGDDREGANDWQHGAPQGAGGDPEEAFTGRRVWGNDLGADGYNGEYQADIHNRLTTPAFAVDANEVIIQYRRWLGVEDGFYDQARVLANDQVIWNNHTTNEQIGDENTIDDEWMLATHRATVSGGSLTLAWEIQSDGGFESHGWNLDDLCLYAPVLAAEDSGTDVAGEPADEDEGIDLSSGGCGCASSSASGGLWMLGALWLATRRRR
jgi:MYXO-CTERM domain-containing protein